jgi:hypothetical protein
MVVRGVGVAGGDLGVAQVDAGVEHGGDEGVPEHVWVHARDLHAGDGLQAVQPGRRRAPAQSGAGAVEQDRPVDAISDGAVDGSSDRGWHRDEHDLVSFADDAQDAVAVFFAEVGDVEADGFGDA